ncbi:MAG: FAD-dependent oxidoreductase [Arcobacteraceae bacterium]
MLKQSNSPVKNKKMNIAIVGAGLVGRVLALNLLKDGHTLTLFDKDSRDGLNAAGYTAAGMLAPFAELETAESIIFDMGVRSVALWPDLLEKVGVGDGFQLKGTIITSHPQDQNELEHFITTLKNKVQEAKNIDFIDKEQLSQLEPDLTQYKKSFYIQNEGQVDSQRFITSSSEYLENHPNVLWKDFTKVDKIDQGRVHIDEEIQEFDWVFDSRGLGAKEHFTDLRGVRGEVLWLESSEINIIRPTRLLHPRYKIYVVPRQNSNRFIVGATEIESEDMSDISVRSSMELLSAVFTVHPSFGEARVVNSKTNCRPAFKDNLPKIENSDKLTRINGLYRHGYLLAPAIVEKALNEGIYK